MDHPIVATSSNEIEASGRNGGGRGSDVPCAAPRTSTFVTRSPSLATARIQLPGSNSEVNALAIAL